MNDINKSIDWERIFHSYETDAPVEVTVLESAGKGFWVDLFGLKAFLPGSETANKAMVSSGDVLEVVVRKINAAKSNVIVSNKYAEEARKQEMADAILDELKEGDVVDGIVKKVVPFGAFVNVGALDGLVHLSEMSWKQISGPRDVVSEGDAVKVRVLGIMEDHGVKKVEFSIKRVGPDPWENVGNALLGKVVEGTVLRLTKFGAFVDIGDVEGLVHLTEMSWIPPKDTRDVLAVGEKVKVIVKDIDAERHRISLSMKDLVPDPWMQLSGEDVLGKSFEGRVVEVTGYGYFIEVLPGLRGLLHKNAFPNEMRRNFYTLYHVGDIITVTISDVKRSERKLLLSPVL